MNASVSPNHGETREQRGTSPDSPSRRARAGGEAQAFPKSPVNNLLKPPRSRLGAAILPPAALTSRPLPPAGRRGPAGPFWCLCAPRVRHPRGRRRRRAAFIPAQHLLSGVVFCRFFFVFVGLF